MKVRTKEVLVTEREYVLNEKEWNAVLDVLRNYDYMELTADGVPPESAEIFLAMIPTV